MPQEGVVQWVDDLIRRAAAARATDVHLDPEADGVRVRFRVDALLRDIQTLPASVGVNVAARLKVMSGLLTYRTDIPQEGGISAQAGAAAHDIRVATFPTIRGERVVLRLLTAASEVRALDDLGHRADLVAATKRLLALPQGLLIVCGPAGSGKTTTLCAMLHEVRATRGGLSILSVEDPVEVRLDGVTQIEIAPERGLTYGVALRSLLRQDPQVLMIGEVRDAETARLVVEAALTGHLLLTSLHSGSPAEGLVRLREMGIPAYQITSAVQALLSQRLLRTVCAACDPAAPRGDCPSCLGSGYAGRTAIGQLVTMTAAVRKGVLNDDDVTALEGAYADSASLHDDARRLVATGRTTAEEVRRVLGE